MTNGEMEFEKVVVVICSDFLDHLTTRLNSSEQEASRYIAKVALDGFDYSRKGELWSLPYSYTQKLKDVEEKTIIVQFEIRRDLQEVDFSENPGASDASKSSNEHLELIVSYPSGLGSRFETVEIIGDECGKLLADVSMQNILAS